MIAVGSLTKQFPGKDGPVTVLDDVTLRVARGEIAAVIGQSGAGKTTLARCINLLERPTRGTVSIGDTELTALPHRRLQVARRAIGTIFQASSLLSRRTAAENVALPLEFEGVGRRERQRRAEELLERVGLGARGGAYPRELSGGQRQRVGIARALALRPSVLLSDEATSGLDPATTKSILALLRSLRDELGLTVLLITHEMDVVREIATYVALMRDGRVVESGAVSALVRDPHSELGRGLLPERAHAAALAGERVWHVTYARPDVPLDWIDRLGRATGEAVSLLGGSIEAIDGVPAGRLTIASAASGGQVASVLAELGLHAEPVGAAGDLLEERAA